jgi:hypothetical protein
LFGLVVLTYVVVVVGGGLLLGDTSTPHVGLSVLATAVVALAFDPAVSRVDGLRRGWWPAVDPSLMKRCGGSAASWPTANRPRT